MLRAINFQMNEAQINACPCKNFKFLVYAYYQCMIIIITYKL